MAATPSDEELERLKAEKLKELMGRSGQPNPPGPPRGVVKLDGSGFMEAVNGRWPVIVDFYADWCGPCRFMEPVFERLARKFAGKLVFGRLNVDENPQLASRYNVFSIPTFIIFSQGRPVNQLVGAAPEPEMERFIRSTLGL